MDPEAVRLVLEGLQPTVERVRVGQLAHDGIYGCLLKAALAKNFEFNQLVFCNNEPGYHFALNPSLRGLCKDVIGLKFLGTFKETDRDKAALILANEQTNSLIQKQQDFFSVHRPMQSVVGNHTLSPDDGAGQRSKALRLKLKEFRSTYQWTSRGDWPTIREMADTTGLTTLYEYLYAVTSSFVHFSPRNLARMGWGDVKTQVFEYSTSNFAAYYCAFNRFYGLFLLVTFITTFSSAMGCRSEFQNLGDELIQILHDEERWPELVTFEEMNFFTRNPFHNLNSPFGISNNANTVPRHSYWQWA